MEIKRYRYRTSLWVALLSTLLFGASIPLMYKEGTTNDRGLIINGIIELGVSGATIFYWVMFVFAILLTSAGIFLLFDWLFGKKKYLILYDDKIHLHYGFMSMKNTEIFYTDIKEIGEQDTGQTKTLMLKTTKKSYPIVKQMMPNKASYEEAKTIIMQKLRI